MKTLRQIAVFLAIVMMLSLAACGSSGDTSEPSDDAGNGVENTAAPSDDITDETDGESDAMVPPDDAVDEGKVVSVVVSKDMSEEMGMPATDTFTLIAEDDILQTMNELLEIDFSEAFSEYNDEQKDLFITTMVASLDSMFAAAQDIEGVVCTSQMEEDIYSIDLTIDCTGSAAEEAAEAGIIYISGNGERLSLNETLSALQEDGYKVVEITNP